MKRIGSSRWRVATADATKVVLRIICSRTIMVVVVSRGHLVLADGGRAERGREGGNHFALIK